MAGVGDIIRSFCRVLESTAERCSTMATDQGAGYTCVRLILSGVCMRLFVVHVTAGAWVASVLLEWVRGAALLCVGPCRGGVARPGTALPGEASRRVGD